jgi:hypothetical protein
MEAEYSSENFVNYYQTVISQKTAQFESHRVWRGNHKLKVSKEHDK